MKVTDIWPSKYVKAADLGDKLVTVTIAKLVIEDMGYGAEAERKPVLYFDKATKGMVVNRTNGMIIAHLYGPETDDWAGKRITLYAAKVKAFGSWHDAIRVKEQRPPAAAPSQPIPDAMQEAPPIDDEEDLLDVDEGQAPTDIDFGMGNAQHSTTSSGATNGHSDTSTPVYAALIDKLTGDCLERANRARKIHAQSKGPSSPEQYRFLAGTVDDLVKTVGGHKAVLEVFVGRAVTSANPPGVQLASKLLDALLEERTVERDGEKVKEANPDYNPDAVRCVHGIWALVLEQNGQASLFEPTAQEAQSANGTQKQPA